MQTQPNIPGMWEVTINSFISVESGANPQNQTIVDENETFDLSLKFTGDGTLWDIIRGLPGVSKFRARFYADGIGLAAPDQDFGAAVGTLNNANDTYTINRTVSIATEGIYECAVALTFFLLIGGVEFPLNGFLGFAGDLLIQVNPQEE